VSVKSRLGVKSHPGVKSEYAHPGVKSEYARPGVKS